MRCKIADILTESITQHEADVSNIGFEGSDMSNNSFGWQLCCFILYKAVIDNLQNKISIVYPKDKFGIECFIWGCEKGEQNSWESQFGFGISNVVNNLGDYIQFMDFPINGEMVHHYFCSRQDARNIFLDIAKCNTEHFSENDKATIADMIRMGYVVSNEKGIFVNAPVFLKVQYEELKSIFAETIEKISDEAEILMETVTKILKNHIPLHLKKLAKDMAYLRLFEDVISAPIAILYDRKYILPYNNDGMLPTTYVIL